MPKTRLKTDLHIEDFVLERIRFWAQREDRSVPNMICIILKRVTGDYESSNKCSSIPWPDESTWDRQITKVDADFAAKFHAGNQSQTQPQPLQIVRRPAVALEPEPAAEEIPDWYRKELRARFKGIKIDEDDFERAWEQRKIEDANIAAHEAKKAADLAAYESQPWLIEHRKKMAAIEAEAEAADAEARKADDELRARAAQAVREIIAEGEELGLLPGPG